MRRIIPRPRHIPTTGDPTPATSLVRYVWRMSGWHQVLISLLALVVASLAMAPLELQRRLVNDAIGTADLDALYFLGGLYVAVALTNAALKYALRLYQQWLSESAIRYSRRHLLDVHARRPGSDGEREDGRAIAIIGKEIDQLGGFVGDGISEIVVNLGMLVAIVGYMLMVDPLVAAAGLIMLVPQAIAAPIAQRRLNRLVEQRVRLVRRLSDSIGHLPLAEDAERLPQEVRSEVGEIYENRMRIAAVKFLIKGFINTVNNLAPAAVFIFGGYLVIEGAASVGVVVAFASGVQKLAEPLRDLANHVRVVARASVQHGMIARWI